MKVIDTSELHRYHFEREDALKFVESICELNDDLSQLRNNVQRVYIEYCENKVLIIYVSFSNKPGHLVIYPESKVEFALLACFVSEFETRKTKCKW